MKFEWKDHPCDCGGTESLEAEMKVLPDCRIIPTWKCAKCLYVREEITSDRIRRIKIRTNSDSISLGE